MVSGHTHKNRKSLPRSRLSLDPSAPTDRRSFCQTRMHHARDLRDNCDDVPLRVGTCERRELLHRRNGKTTRLYCPCAALCDIQNRQSTNRHNRTISILRASCDRGRASCDRGRASCDRARASCRRTRASCAHLAQPRKRARHTKTRQDTQRHAKT